MLKLIISAFFKNMLSAIIPSRQPQYLQKTIDDLLAKAEGEIEVIVVLDGIWPDVPIKDDPRVHIIHHGTPHDSLGMRESINRGVSLSKGEYIMKTDEHCLFSPGFDVGMIVYYQEHDVVIPRRKRLDAENWIVAEDRRPDIDYMHIDFPFPEGWQNDITTGLHGAEWRQRFYDRKDEMIDLTPSMQGSCYFMSRKHWDEVIGFLNSEKYSPFTMEAQEIGMKTWFTGGRVVVNKKVYYAHLHKGKKGKGYGFSNAQWEMHKIANEKGRLYARDYWINTKDYAPYDWDWFMTIFPDMPGWGKDWKERIAEAQKLIN